MDDRAERVAVALYAASGGDLKLHPWPCPRARFYRNLAKAALKEADREVQAG